MASEILILQIFDWIVRIFVVICAFWVVRDIIVNKKEMGQNKRVLWIVCAILFSIVTAIVYSETGKEKFLKFR